MSVEIWTYRETLIPPGCNPAEDLVGYSVEATDGSIGTIDAATSEIGASYVVVDTGPWIFGSRVVLPAYVLGRVDRDAECVHVDLTREQIKDAPTVQAIVPTDEAQRENLGDYYRSLAAR